MKNLLAALIVILTFSVACVAAEEVDCSEKCWILSYEAREVGGILGYGVVASFTATASEPIPTHSVLHVERFASKASASKRLANLSVGWQLVPRSIAVYQATQEKVVTKETATRIPQPDVVRTETAYCLEAADCERDRAEVTGSGSLLIGTGTASNSTLVWNGSDTTTWQAVEPAPKKNTSKGKTKHAY